MIPGTILAPPLSAHPKQPRHLLVIIGNFAASDRKVGSRKILLLEPFVLPYPADRKTMAEGFGSQDPFHS